MRLTRFERNRSRNTIRKGLLFLLVFAVIAAAVAASMFFMGIFSKGDNAETLADVSTPSNATAFKYKYEIVSKAIYRIELGDFKSFEEAEAFIKSLKTKRLNGYIIKEEGYKAIYGVFTSLEEANAVKEIIAVKVKGNIKEIKLPGFNLKYNDSDNTFIQLVQASDKLLWEVMSAKSAISRDIAVKSKNNMTEIFDSISKSEEKLEKYLGYAKEIDVSKEQKLFRDNLVLLLEDALSYRTDNEKDYYRLQNGLLNQVEAYRRFGANLSI